MANIIFSSSLFKKLSIPLWVQLVLSCHSPMPITFQSLYGFNFFIVNMVMACPRCSFNPFMGSTANMTPGEEVKIIDFQSLYGFNLLTSLSVSLYLLTLSIPLWVQHTAIIPLQEGDKYTFNPFMGSTICNTNLLITMEFIYLSIPLWVQLNVLFTSTIIFSFPPINFTSPPSTLHPTFPPPLKTSYAGRMMFFTN